MCAAAAIRTDSSSSSATSRRCRGRLPDRRAAPGRYAERLNTDAAIYGGSGIGNAGGVRRSRRLARPAPFARLTLPPLGALILEREPALMRRDLGELRTEGAADRPASPR